MEHQGAHFPLSSDYGENSGGLAQAPEVAASDVKLALMRKLKLVAMAVLGVSDPVVAIRAGY